MRDAATAALRELGASVAADARLGHADRAAAQASAAGARAARGGPTCCCSTSRRRCSARPRPRSSSRAVRGLKARGAAVLYVSHRLDEVLAIADRVTVLRDGRWVSTDPVGAVDTKTLVHRMVGRDLRACTAHRRRARWARRCCGWRTWRRRTSAGFSLTVRRGEVVGLAGLVGAGRSEILEAIAGLRPRRRRAGRVRVRRRCWCRRTAAATVWCRR